MLKKRPVFKLFYAISHSKEWLFCFSAVEKLCNDEKIII